MTDIEDTAAMRRIIEAGRWACRVGRLEPADGPYLTAIERDWWQRGYREVVAERESVARRAQNDAEMQNFGAALRLFRHGAAAARASWNDQQWLRLEGDQIMVIYANGGSEPWRPTHAELLATDWTASSGVVGWTGLDLDINGKPWEKPT